MTGGCIFCGKSPTTKTHVFRKAWLEHLMPGGPDGYFIHRHARTGDNPLDVTWQRDSFDIQPHAACQDCNGGWMHQLEHMGENLVEPLALGKGRTFPTNTHAQAPPWIARTQFELARALLARAGPGDERRAVDLLRRAELLTRQLGCDRSPSR